MVSAHALVGCDAVLGTWLAMSVFDEELAQAPAGPVSLMKNATTVVELNVLIRPTHRSRDETLTQPELVWELHRAGVKVPIIAQRVGKHRATIYHWLKGIRLGGLREFVQNYKNAKKRPRRRKVNP